MSFQTLGLAPTLLSAVLKAGFTAPTPVQSAAIPKALAGRDLMVSAQTGSGKTAAFMLPALNRISAMPANKGTGVQVLVLTPTRELAMQVADASKTYGAHIKDLRIAVVVGGMPYGAQLKALSRRVDVLVATPGRLIDHLQAKRVNLSTVHTLVLDEADRMLDMGFIEDIETIVAGTPKDRQTLLFSATLDGTIARLAARMMNNPEQIQLTTQNEKHANISQSLLYADDNSHKMRLLDHLLRDTELDQAIVFTATKRGADDLADRLAEQGFAAAALHGDMNQRQRTRTLGMLQKGRVRILVATDVAARGIDVQGISHAINYDLPLQAEDYVHRIGRTGRAGRNGLAYTLASHAERHKVRRIEHFIGQPIPAQTIAGLEPKKTVRPTYSDRKGGGKPGYGGKPGGYRGASSYEGRSGRREDRSGFDGKPRFGEKPRFEDKPRFDDRPRFGDKPRFDDRPRFSGKSAFGERPSREGLSPRDEFSPRSEFTSRRDGPAQGDRPARRERPAFGDRPSFSGRPAFAGKGSRSERREGSHAAPNGDRAKRPARPSFAKDSVPRKSKPAVRRSSFA